MRALMKNTKSILSGLSFRCPRKINKFCEICPLSFAGLFVIYGRDCDERLDKPGLTLLKASLCNFYQKFNNHTLRCDFLYIHDDTHDNISKGKKIILSRWIFHLCRFSCTLSLKTELCHTNTMIYYTPRHTVTCRV